MKAGRLRTRNARIERAMDAWFNMPADAVTGVLRVLSRAEKDGNECALIRASLLLQRAYDPEGLALWERGR